MEGLNSRRAGWVEEEEKECVCDGGDQSQTAVPRYTPCFRHWAIMRGLPEPVGLSRALTLPTLSQQAANACGPISAQDSATCKEFYVVHIFYYLNKSRSYGWWLKERSDALRPKIKTISTVKKKKKSRIQVIIFQQTSIPSPAFASLLWTQSDDKKNKRVLEGSLNHLMSLI